MKGEPVREVLTGGFPPLVCAMNQQRTAQSMVTHLVRCTTCNDFIDHPKGVDRGQTGAKDLPRKGLAPCEEVAGGKPIKWDSILKDLLSRCPQFCRDELMLPRPALAVTWRETSSRRVLAPLTLKENADNIMAGERDMNRKRKSAGDNSWTPTKHVRVDDVVKPCSVVIKKTPLKVLLLQYKCFKKRPVVKLFDVTKEIPQVQQEEKPVTQDEYMGALGMGSKHSILLQQALETKINNPIKLSSHPQIPFSSDYGRHLLARERHCLPQEVALRKLERTEWYLKGGDRIVKDNQRVAAYDKRARFHHTYRFPKRQCRQNHRSIQQDFIRYLCKPVCVELEKIDISPYLTKMKKGETAMKTIVVNKAKDENMENTVVPRAISANANTTVLTPNGTVLNEDKVISVNLQPESNGMVCNGKTTSVEVFSEKPCKIRRSLRVNHMDTL